MRILHILLLASLSATVAAQDSLLCRDYGFMLRQDAWLQTDNAASLTRLCHSGMAEAELTVNHDKGGLADFSGAQRSLQVDASVEALQRLNRRTVLYGSMGYSNFTGWDMTGSTLLFPSTTHHPSPITHHPSPTFGPVLPQLCDNCIFLRKKRIFSCGVKEKCLPLCRFSGFWPHYVL